YAAGSKPATEQKEGASEPSQVKVISRLKFRMDGVGYYGDKRTHLFVIPADGSAKARQLTSGDFDHQFPTWAPDGKALYCTALRRPDADDLNRSDIWRVAVATGETELVWENAGPVWGLKAAPDGRHLLFGGHENQHEGSTTPELLILPLGHDGLAAGVAVSLTHKLDRPIGPAGTSDLRAMPMFSSGEWASDGKGAYFLLGARGDSNLWYTPIEGGEPIQLTRYVDRTVADFSLAADGKIALIIGDGVNPDDIFLFAKGDSRRLTDHNPIARELALVVPERFTYEGAGGRQMDGWLMRPADYEPGRRYPTVLSIHGGPHGAYGSGLMVYFQALAGAGFAVIYTNPRGSQTYGQQFALDVVGDWGGQDFVDIMNGVDAAVATGVVDPERLGVMGWSYGGFMTSWTVTQTDRFKAAIAGAPVVNRYNFIGTSDIPWFMEHQGGGSNPWGEDGGAQLLERSPIRYANRVTTPTMVVCGEGDLRCPIEQAEQFYVALKRIGKAPTVHIRYPGEYHGVARPEHKLDRYERTVAWFRHYLTK
ncbi:MAG: peptidase prolyl oligopeptidase active site domain protein, partial [Firmicutes bacterium]|nr:peptidase prolyl oligopeptidase active site domain protein [Bacillota bacterium]